MPEQPLSLAQHYHERTKYDPETLQSKAKPLDWDSQPVPFKEYKIGMPFGLISYMEDRPENIIDPDERFWHRLARFFFYAYGISGVLETGLVPQYFRTVPSAGGLYPVELYLISRGTQHLPAGLYNYQARQHTLMHYWESEVWDHLRDACFWHPALESTQLALVVTTVFDRSAWRYQDRAYRRVLLDSGHLLGNLELGGSVQDFRPHLITGFADKAVNDLLYLDGEQESTIAVLPLADLKQLNQHLPLFETSIASETKTNYTTRIPDGELLYELHDATLIEFSDRKIPWQLPEISPERADKYNFPFCLKVETRSQPILWGDGLAALEETIIKRRSTRGYSGMDLTLNQLKALLDFTYHPENYIEQHLDHRPDYCDLYAVETFIAVSGVEGLEDGCYYYAPHLNELRQIRFKNFRQELHFLCLGQDLGRDAAAVVFHTADLKGAIEKWGDRAYRYLHLDAGHLGQRLNLAAVRLGIGVSGIAGFFDDQVNDTLGIPNDEAVLYITTLGRARPRSI